MRFFKELREGSENFGRVFRLGIGKVISGSLCVLCLVNLTLSCGPRSSSNKRLSPEAAFEKLKPSAENPILCQWTSLYGCGFLSASSLALSQKVESANFLVQCVGNENGYSVMLRDRIGEGYGTALALHISGMQEFSETEKICGSLATQTVQSQISFRDGTCAVSLHYGDGEVWSQDESPCSVSFKVRDGRNSGTIDCPLLTNSRSSWTFDDPVVFSCP